MIITKKTLNISKETFGWILSLIIITPLMMVLLNSVKTVTESATMSLKLPSEVHLENYLTVLNSGGIFRSFLNSLLISSVSTGITIFVSAMAAFTLARKKTKTNNFIYSIFLLGLVAPINYISTMKVLQMLQIINTYMGTYLLYSALYIPFTLFLYYGFISTIPTQMDDAALIDGCGPLRFFYSIILPMLKPVTITAFIINFLNCWNDFIIPLYFLNSSKKWGMIMVMYNYFGQFTSSWNLVSAAMILNLIPVISVYILGQKYIISGMTAGAVKG